MPRGRSNKYYKGIAKDKYMYMLVSFYQCLPIPICVKRHLKNEIYKSQNKSALTDEYFQLTSIIENTNS